MSKKTRHTRGGRPPAPAAKTDRGHPDHKTPRQMIVDATGDLRHLYRQMIRGGWRDAQVAEAALGLLGPAIERLERAVVPLHLTDRSDRSRRPDPLGKRKPLVIEFPAWISGVLERIEVNYPDWVATIADEWLQGDFERAFMQRAIAVSRKADLHPEGRRLIEVGDALIARAAKRPTRKNAMDLVADAERRYRESERVREQDRVEESNAVSSEFFLLLGAAQAASKAVDDFDLHSADAASAREFARLQREQRIATTALVEHVTAHGDAVVAALSGHARVEVTDDEGENGSVRLHHVLERVMSLATGAVGIVPIADLDAVFTVNQRRGVRAALRIMRGQGSVEIVEDCVRLADPSLVNIVDTIDTNSQVSVIVFAGRRPQRAPDASRT